METMLCCFAREGRWLFACEFFAWKHVVGFYVLETVTYASGPRALGLSVLRAKPEGLCCGLRHAADSAC